MGGEREREAALKSEHNAVVKERSLYTKEA